jgi:hypothetical protein
VEGRQRRGQGRGWEAGSGEKWPKQCMHIWINELKKRVSFEIKKANILQSFLFDMMSETLSTEK